MDFEPKVEDPCSLEQIPDIKGRMSWFMAIMVAMFYSQHSRAILSTSIDIDNLNLGNANLEKFFKNLFHHNFEQGFTDTDILKLLYETNRELFMIEPADDIWAGGIDPIIYIGALYDLLNINYIMFEFNENTEDSLIYSLFNKEYNQHVSKKFDITNKFLSFEIKKNSKFLSRFNRFNSEYDKMIMLKLENELKIAAARDPSIKSDTDKWVNFKRWLMKRYQKDNYKIHQDYKYNKYVANVNYHQKQIDDYQNYLYNEARRKYPEEEIYKEDNLTEDIPDFSNIPAPPILIVRVLEKIPDGHYDTDQQYYKKRTYNYHVKVKGKSGIYGDENYLLNRVNDDNIYDNITSMKEKIMYMGEYYVLDSVILYNDLRGAQHQVVGITCNKKKYVYNALNYKSEGDNLFYTESEKPIKENWDINKRAWDNIVRTNVTKKLLGVLSINEDDDDDVDVDYYENNGTQFPYNFKKGIRTLIYVKIKKNLSGGLSLKKNLKLKKPTKSSKKPPEGKVLNPKTGRYILIKNKPITEKKVPKKSAKKPPESKVLNPKTGRYILIKNKPITEKKIPKKSTKKPPEGKVLNPKTGRYILIKNKPSVEKKAPKKSAKKVA